MTRFNAVVLTMLLAPATAHSGHHPPPHHPPMGPGMRNAMATIEQVCARDVSTLCPSPEEQLMMPPILRLGAPRDPFMSFMSNPNEPAPMMDLSLILDSMMNEALQPQTFTIHFLQFADEPQEGQNKPPQEDLEEAPKETSKEVPQEAPREQQPAPEQILDSMVHSLMHRSTEGPDVVAKHIVEYGNNLLKSEDLGDRVSLARRLTQVSPDMAHNPPLPLPFGCHRNRCLMSAYDQNAVSPACSDALKAAEDVRSTVVRREMAVEHDSQIFIRFTMIYVFLAIVTLMALRKHLQKIGRHLHKEMALKRSILQTVYSNPALKAKVEDAIGAKIGAVPPLPPHILAQMGGHAFPHRIIFCIGLAKCMVFASILTLVFVNPFLAMPLLCVLMFARLVQLTFCPPQPPHLMCSCCCCGLSTDDVQSGNISAKQACCTCCNGMGVCGPACADCCGLDPDGACDCCEDGCDCCNPPSKCCCCDVTSKTKFLTQAQMDCTCCKGSGICADGCKACCGDETGCDCCSDGCNCCSGDVCRKPKVRAAECSVYQGIPIQVV